MTGPKIGRVYADDDPVSQNRPDRPEPSLMRKAILLKLEQMKAAAFDRDAEQAFDALEEVMKWHQPWQFWTQVFRPTYIGERYDGAGCRSCGPSPSRDCMTVRGIAQGLRIME